MTSATILLTILFATAHGFTHNNIIRCTSHTIKSGVSLAQQPQPNFGDWTNDDYLNNLGGGSGDENSQYNDQYNEEQQYNQNQNPPQNSLTDEEITQWALNAASFYNTEVSVQEAYGVPRDGPPRREEGTEVDGWWVDMLFGWGFVVRGKGDWKQITKSK